jgi:hypothetical protein
MELLLTPIRVASPVTHLVGDPVTHPDAASHLGPCTVPLVLGRCGLRVLPTSLRHIEVGA